MVVWAGLILGYCRSAYHIWVVPGARPGLRLKALNSLYLTDYHNPYYAIKLRRFQSLNEINSRVYSQQRKIA